MIQIIGGNLEQAFEHYNIKAEKKFQAEPDFIGVALEVWELSNEDYTLLSEIQDWLDKPFAHKSWWVNGGCNHSKDEVAIATIKDQKLKVFVSVFHDNEITWDYINLNDYFESYLGISKHSNMAFYIHSLAELNNMTKAEFMKKFW